MDLVLPEGFSEATVLGRGGFSTVYRAYQRRFDRWVAVKVLDVEELDDASARRFERECAAIGRISSHPNVLTVFESGFLAPGRPFLVSELCQGSYADRVRPADPVPVQEVAQVAFKISSALAAAHAVGMVHRDVKPANILLSSYGEPVLADFGLTLRPDIDATRGVDAYTPSHASPETFERAVATPASDVYSLASTLYTLLEGRPPFPITPGEGLGGHALRVIRDAPPPLTRAAPSELVALIMAGLSKDVSARPSLPWSEAPLREDVTVARPSVVPTDVEEATTLRPLEGDEPLSTAAAPSVTAKPTGSARRGRRTAVWAAAAVSVTRARLALVLLLLVLLGIPVAGWRHVRSQYYVGLDGSSVVVFQGVHGSVAGIAFHTVAERTTVTTAGLSELDTNRLTDGITAASLRDAESIVLRLIASSDTVPDDPCTYTPSASSVRPLPSALPPAETTPARTAQLTTNRGAIAITLDSAAAPCTVRSFAFLIRAHYFDGSPCHRLTTEGIFVLQCGDPTGSGSGGPGYSFPDENLTGATYPRGTVVMANAGPNTNGSQFFLVYRDTQLPPSYTPFGRVSGGLAVLDELARAGVQGGLGDGRPALSVSIRSASVH